MALDLSKTALQLDKMADGLKDSKEVAGGRLTSASELLTKFELDQFAESRSASLNIFQWSTPDFPIKPIESIPPSEKPINYVAIGVDGSHIDVNRHIPVDCFLINTGIVTLKYGMDPVAEIESFPKLFFGHSDTILTDPTNPHRYVPIQGTVLGAIRAVHEIEALVKKLQTKKISDPKLPIVGLMDGTLVMLDLLRAGVQDFVIRSVLEERFVKALDDIRRFSATRQVIVASYISFPGSTEVMDGVRLLACPFDTADCRNYCRDKGVERRPCDASALGLKDRDVFGQFLDDGFRSPIFGSSSQLVKTYYGDNDVKFFYMKVGEEIARVEVPVWVAEDSGKLDLVHSVILDQCELGSGYPACLIEAHEQAVISTADRAYFMNLVEDALETRNISFFTSGKDRSKRLRWL